MAADLYASSPSELKERLEVQRRGEPFLVYRDGDGTQCIFVLGAGGRLTVGRRPENDLALCFDPNLSRVHVAFERAGGEWTIVDDGLSRNGSYLNGERVYGHRRLRDGDLLRLGATLLVYRAPDEDPAPTAVLATATVAPALSATQRHALVALCRPCKGAVGPSAPASNREIADELHLSVEAVKAHLRALFSKFSIPDLPHNRKRLRLVAEAFSTGAVSPREL
ncbi:MAG: FHA domain-containing protein [Thermoleophilaceae bacterium]|nr:FHA domain-containing protein [Thermoleophilaceae bacterium]